MSATGPLPTAFGKSKLQRRALDRAVNADRRALCRRDRAAVLSRLVIGPRHAIILLRQLDPIPEWHPVGRVLADSVVNIQLPLTL